MHSDFIVIHRWRLKKNNELRSETWRGLFPRAPYLAGVHPHHLTFFSQPSSRADTHKQPTMWTHEKYPVGGAKKLRSVRSPHLTVRSELRWLLFVTL